MITLTFNDSFGNEVGQISVPDDSPTTLFDLILEGNEDAKRIYDKIVTAEIDKEILADLRAVDPEEVA
jgi:hypothetical protein